MIFPYWEELQGTEPRILPLVPLTVHGPAGPIEMPALVDSGAEQSVLPSALASELGISLEDAQTAVIVGVGEHEISSHLTLVEMQLGSHRWLAPVVFADGKVRPLLGQPAAVLADCRFDAKRPLFIPR